MSYSFDGFGLNYDSLIIKIPTGVNSYVNIYSTNDNTTADPLVFENLTIEEDMFSDSLVGSVTLYDPTNGASIINKITFNRGIIIQITGNNRTINKFFDILDYNWISDLSTQKMSSYDGRPHKVIIRFASKLLVYDNFNYLPNEDFIGVISDGSDYFNNNRSIPYSFEPNIGASNLAPATNSEDKLPSFVHYLFRYSGQNASYSSTPVKDFTTHPTGNSIWFKNNPQFYPFSKIGNNPTINQIMNYVCEYACREDKPNYVDFFFWEDLAGWNFKSLSILSELQNPLITYEVTADHNSETAIGSFEVINTTSPAKLISSGAFFGQYIRVKPKWNSIYQNELDTHGEVDKTVVELQYPDQGLPPLNIANSTVFNLLTPENKGTLRMSDTVYGYFSNPYNTKASPWWNYYTNVTNYTGNTTFPSEYDQPERNEQYYWRAQFDFCELPASWLSKIYFKIKWNENLRNAKLYYADLKRLKQEHQIYKNKVCCIRNVPETFFAVITKSKKIYGSEGQTLSSCGSENYKEEFVEKDSGGIYAYEWREVEFWPREDVAHVLKDPNSKVIEFENNDFPFVFVTPTGAAYGQQPTESNPTDTRAFNLNEILNSRLPADEFRGTTGISGPFTITMNPGIANVHGFNSEDTDLRKQYVSYPQKFSLMPVGKFRIVTAKNCSPNWADDGTTSKSDSDFYQAGRVVQMFKIPRNSLTSIIGKTLSYESCLTPGIVKNPLEYMFIFDVDNDHDGLCTNC